MNLSCPVTDEHVSEWRKPDPIARPVFDRFVKGWSRDRPKATLAVRRLGDPKVQLLTDPVSKRPSRKMLLLWRNARRAPRTGNDSPISSPSCNMRRAGR